MNTILSIIVSIKIYIILYNSVLNMLIRLWSHSPFNLWHILLDNYTAHSNILFTLWHALYSLIWNRRSQTARTLNFYHSFVCNSIDIMELFWHCIVSLFVVGISCPSPSIWNNIQHNYVILGNIAQNYSCSLLIGPLQRQKNFRRLLNFDTCSWSSFFGFRKCSWQCRQNHPIQLQIYI